MKPSDGPTTIGPELEKVREELDAWREKMMSDEEPDGDHPSSGQEQAHRQEAGTRIADGATLHVVQLRHVTQGRKVGVVLEDERIHLLNRFPTVYHCCHVADTSGKTLSDVILGDMGGETLSYDAIYAGSNAWRLLPPFDHPDDSAHCIVAGTGLTHRKSAENRNAMHDENVAAQETDSMRMYRIGVEGGRPDPGQIGAQPEWFYKGDGSILRAHNEKLTVPGFALDGGEEAELAGCYYIDTMGNPRRVGFCIGNEFSDHVMERQNYLYLAPSKMRECSIGPELIIGIIPNEITGSVRIHREIEDAWVQEIVTGFDAMVHSLENLEHHQFKYPHHRKPGDVHVHFFGAGAFSFGAGIALESNDRIVISLDGMGRPLVNTLAIAPPVEWPLAVEPL